MKTHHTEDWRNILNIKQEEESGIILAGMRYKENLTQKELALILGSKQHHVSEMEHGYRPIGKKMARKLATIFKVDYRVFL